MAVTFLFAFVPAVGGSSVLYAAHWQRNMPSDFRVRTLDGVGDDWPLTYEDLVPYYEQVELDFGVSGLSAGLVENCLTLKDRLINADS